MRHRKKHRRTKWTKEMAWNDEVNLAMECYYKEVAHWKSHPEETQMTCSFKCGCPPLPKVKKVY